MDQPSQPTLSTGTAEVLKSDIGSILAFRNEAGLDGEFSWPIAPFALAMLYRSSGEHCRAIHVKAEGAFGGGLEGDRAAALEELFDTGSAETFTGLGLDLETYGNAFLQVVRSPVDQRPISLRRLPAITMARFRKGFLQRVPLPNGGTRKITFTQDEVIHLRDQCPFGKRYSLPSWIGAEGMLDLAQAAVRHNQSFFRNSAIPEYAVVFKGGSVSQAQKDAVQSFFRAEYQGIDQAHRTLVMSCGEDQTIEFEQLTADVKDGDFLKLLDAVRDRLPIAHAVPPRMIGIMSAGQLGGGGEVAQQMFVFEHLTLRPRRRRMLDQLRPVLAELGVVPGKADGTLAPDQVRFLAIDLTPPKDDTENLADLVAQGVVSPQEGRSLLTWLDAADGSSPQPIERSAPDDGLVIAALAKHLART